MLRALAILLVYAVGGTIGLGNAVIASCLFIWNDIFRPIEFTRRHPLVDNIYPVHICTAILILSILVKPWKRRWNMSATMILLSFVWFLICALLAEYRDLAIDRTLTVAKYFIPLALISATLCTRRAQQIFVYTLAASVGIWLSFQGFIAFIRMSPMIDMSIAGGQMSDRNDFLVAGTACIPLMLYVAYAYQGRWQAIIRKGAFVATFFGVVAGFFSLSRGAVLGFSMLLAWWAFLTGRFFKRVMLGALIAFAASFLMPSFVTDRMSTIEVGRHQTETSARNRVDHIITAVKMTLDYPLTGVGADNFPYVALRYSVFAAEPHSIWLKCSSEYGLPMLVSFVLFIGLLLVRLRRRASIARSLGDRDGEVMATALSCAIVGFLATGSFTSQFVSEYLWAILGVAGAFLATPVETPLDGTEPAPGSQVPAVAPQPAA
jgi:hypothetical protein